MMIGLYVFLSVLATLIYVVMIGTMIILERDKPKNLIIWSILFLLTNIVGYVAYIAVRFDFYRKQKSLKVKLWEDDVYAKLISNNVVNNGVKSDNEIFDFNNLAFNTQLTVNNHFEIFHNKSLLKESLIKNLKNAKNYIIIELIKLNSKDLIELKDVLIDRSKADVVIKIVYEKAISRSFVKELKQAGIKFYRFSKYGRVGKSYLNLRNMITIDGEIAYLGDFNTTKRNTQAEVETAFSFIKIVGDIVQDIDVQVHKDAIFASGKYIEYNKCSNSTINNNIAMQLVNNDANTNLELALIKAICMAKKSIQMELSSFIPTESIMSLLQFAINSNIQVRLMVPLKNNRNGKYYASRAYAKELALHGANVYLFDGFINFNAITLDDEYVIFGSYVMDREHLITSPQSMLFIKDEKAVKDFNKIFNNGIENSYRINNAKIMLLREKFFKNFV